MEASSQQSRWVSTIQNMTYGCALAQLCNQNGFFLVYSLFVYRTIEFREPLKLRKMSNNQSAGQVPQVPCQASQCDHVHCRRKTVQHFESLIHGRQFLLVIVTCCCYCLCRIPCLSHPPIFLFYFQSLKHDLHPKERKISHHIFKHTQVNSLLHIKHVIKHLVKHQQS